MSANDANICRRNNNRQGNHLCDGQADARGTMPHPQLIIGYFRDQETRTGTPRPRLVDCMSECLSSLTISELPLFRALWACQSPTLCQGRDTSTCLQRSLVRSYLRKTIAKDNHVGRALSLPAELQAQGPHQTTISTIYFFLQCLGNSWLRVASVILLLGDHICMERAVLFEEYVYRGRVVFLVSDFNYIMQVS